MSSSVLGIALLRLIYVKYHTLLESYTAEKLISNLILIVALAMSGFSTATLLQAQRKGQDLRSVCFGMSLEMEEAIGAILDETTPKWTFIATGLILTAFEMYAYSEIFKFLTKNVVAIGNELPSWGKTSERTC